MRLGIEKYRKMQAELDIIGITTSIVCNGSRSYQFLVNMQPVKQYTNRHSCNRSLAKLHSEKIRSCWDILGINETKSISAINKAYIARCEQLAAKSGSGMSSFLELTHARKQAFHYAKGFDNHKIKAA